MSAGGLQPVLERDTLHGRAHPPHAERTASRKPALDSGLCRNDDVTLEYGSDDVAQPCNV